MKHISTLSGLKKTGLIGLLFISLFVSSCRNTGKGIQKDYQHNKEEVGEEIEEAGEELQDEDN